MNTYEQPFWDDNQLVIGIDEAGRGPLAGPLIVAGVVLPIGYHHALINDSKQLSEKKRKLLFHEIMSNACEVIIVIVDETTIDRENIYQATRQAMANIARCSIAQAVLTDAMPLTLDKSVTSIIKGDSKSISIAAASIIAKVIRDTKMKHLDKIYPEYGFAKHKGYGTKAHTDAIQRYGITPIHRKSFAPVSFYQESLFANKG
ncbi:MAG: ribonuclease HII [Firmicutes bacterium HGW-Firmicutes-10]|jgi:ribonuclease HII|nr:MAG: ribonuclease HII [Firmicutes bacterium HGW-Firmicutes-10]